MADIDPIEGQPAPIKAGNMANAPEVVDPRRRGGRKDQGPNARYARDDASRKRNDDKIVQGHMDDGDDDREDDDTGMMDDATLLDLLRANEMDASQYTTGPLRAARIAALDAYFQRPYGNEDEGWSDYVSAVTSETVEWMLPDLLDLFVSSDKAVVFEPTRADEEQQAQDATAGVNHVFYQQNNGFLILYTAIKDMLMVKTCAIHWFGNTKRKRCRVPFKNASGLQVAALMKQYADKGAVVETATPSEAPILGPTGQPFMNPMTGQPHMQVVWTGRLTYVEEQKQVKVEAFEPENLGVLRSWTSPLLEDCPYVVRWLEISLSDLNELADQYGFDRVEAKDLSSSQQPQGMYDESMRRNRTADPQWMDMRPRPEGVDRDDESQTMGWLRIEWVLVDCDGDGIAERREIWRLDKKILYNEECLEVPVCTGSPILVPHRWDGQSVVETMLDLQLLDTELNRGVINNAFSSNNPRKIVLTDRSGNPQVDIPDLLDGRPGGIIRTQSIGAIQMEPTEYVGDKMAPLLSRIDELRERRSGVTRNRMGMDPNALVKDRTLGESQMMDEASQKRVKLIGRIMAEIVLKPVMRGILRLLTSGDYDTMFFKLRGEFVELDPNDWKDHYNMTTNVGLGTGDVPAQLAALAGIRQDQIQLAQSPIGPGMVTPHQLYSTAARMVELSGFKNVGEFYLEPPKDAKMPERPSPPPPWQLQAKQMELDAEAKSAAMDQQFEMAKLTLEARNKAQAAADQNNIQMQNDARDAMRASRDAAAKDELEALKAVMEKYKIDIQRQTAIEVARLSSKKDQDPEDMGDDPNGGKFPDLDAAMAPVIEALQRIYDSVQPQQ